jgi:hypothetical protein
MEISPKNTFLSYFTCFTKLKFWQLLVMSYTFVFANNLYAQQTNNQNPENLLQAEFFGTLIGKNITDKEVQKLFAYCNQQETTSTTETNTIYSCPLRGFQIEMSNQIVEKIILYDTNVVESYAKETIKFSKFSQKLLKNLTFEDNRAVTINKLGKPTKIYENILVYQIAKVEFSIVFKKTVEKIIISTNHCIVGNCKDGFGIYLSRNGDKYEGNWKNLQRHGKGIATFANGDVYNGYWLHDLQDGQGTMTYKNGTAKQRGIWERGSFKGEMYLQTDLLYQIIGKHKTHEALKLVIDNYAKDKGYKIIQLLHDHQVYKFNNGKLNLFFDEYGFLQKIDLLRGGVFDFLPSITNFIKPNTDQKQILHLFGEPKEKREIIDEEHKHFFWVYQDSIYQQIFYFNAKRLLQSVQLQMDSPMLVLKNKFFGQCLTGNCKNGYGEMLASIGKYRGTFKAELLAGKGRLSLASGCWYYGRFKNNLRHGYGVCQWTDQSSYAGQWRNNVFQGLGTYIYANKDRYEGNWEKGKRNGYGKMRYANGIIYLGNWKDDLRNGEGILQQKNGKKKRGIWLNDEMIQK